MSIISVLLVLLLSVTSPRQSPPSGSVPRYERAPCPVEIAPGERVDCGILVVPERRGVAGTRAIRLPVMIFRSRLAVPAADPVLYMAGGPGGSTVAGRRSGKNLPFLDDRDVILLEQRGAHHAQPALRCPDINRLKGEVAAGRLRGTAATEALSAAAAACRRQLTSSGVDLDGYTSAATADDIEDLRKALGYETWNLHGISYSTRLMLTVLRRHPAGVRSVILDSVLPPDVNFDEVSAANLWRALNVVFDACAVDRGCSAAHPDLRGTFARLVAAADVRPLPIGVVDEPAGPSRSAARRSSTRSTPRCTTSRPFRASHRSSRTPRHGRYETLAALVKGNQGPSSFAWGLRYSVWCAEEMPFQDPARIASQVSPALGLGGINEGDGHAGRVPRVERDAGRCRRKHTRRERCPRTGVRRRVRPGYASGMGPRIARDDATRQVRRTPGPQPRRGLLCVRRGDRPGVPARSARPSPGRLRPETPGCGLRQPLRIRRRKAVVWYSVCWVRSSSFVFCLSSTGFCY